MDEHGCAPRPPHLRTLEFGIHIISRVTKEYSLDFLQPFKNVTTLLSWWATEKWAGGWIWSMNQSLPTSDYQVGYPAIFAYLWKSEWMKSERRKQSIVSMISYRKKTVKGAGKNLEFSDQSISTRAPVKASRRDIQLSIWKFYGR